MATKTDNTKQLRRRVRRSYAVSTVSVALVLFLLGGVGYLIVNALWATDRIRENITVYVMLKGGVSAEQEQGLEKKIKAYPGVKEAVFVSRDAAAEEFSAHAGGDFRLFLDQNPLPDSYEVKFQAKASDKEKLAMFEKKLLEYPEVDEVVYHRDVLDSVTSNINKFNLILMLFGGALFFISLVLLNNTIRLTIFSRRHIINTMKLVGATSGFIRRSFLWSAMGQGVIAGLIAGVMFLAMVSGLNEALPDINFIRDRPFVLAFPVGMILLGVAISVIFTIFVVQKFIRMQSGHIHLY